MIAIPKESEDRVGMISQVFTSPEHITVFRELNRTDSWLSVPQIENEAVPKPTVSKIIKDFTRGGILDAQTISCRRTYRLADRARWVGSLIEEPDVFLIPGDIPGRDRLEELLSEDKLARQIVNSLLEESGSLTLRQISAEVGAWAMEVKARLNLLIDENLVLRRGLGYTLSRKTVSQIANEVA